MAKRVQPGHAVLPESKANSEMSEALTKVVHERVRDEFDRRARDWRDRLKYAVLGFGLFITAMPLGGNDVVRVLHAKAFPADGTTDSGNVPLISFGSGIELRAGDSKALSSFMSFYAEENQRVHLYLTITPRLLGPGGIAPSVVISVDGRPIGGPIRSWVGGFRDISKTLSSQSLDLGREQNVHQLGFAIADFEPEASGEVVISAIILVF